MRTLLTAEHIAAQSAFKRTPYIKLTFTSPDLLTTVDLDTDGTYEKRIIGIEHNEASYEDFAYITLKDYDRTIPDLRGYSVDIGYGDTTTNGNEYTYSQTPRLWVMVQETVYASNKAIVVLTLEGMWARLKRQVAMFNDSYDPSVSVWGNFTGLDGYTDRSDFGAGVSYYGMIEYIISTMMHFYLDPLTVDDGIIDEANAQFYFYNDANSHQVWQTLLYQIITSTHCVLRAGEDKHFVVLKPQSEDAADITFYNYQAPYFYEYSKKDSYTYPNYVILFYNGASYWINRKVVYASDQPSIDAYGNIPFIVHHPTCTSGTEAQAKANAILANIQRERDTGYITIPHDCRIQLYDKVAVSVV
jgi:hypothetical protein